LNVSLTTAERRRGGASLRVEAAHSLDDGSHRVAQTYVFWVTHTEIRFWLKWGCICW